MFSTYEGTIDYLFNALPVYQKIGGKAMKTDLSNIEKLCAALHNPERKLRCIHIAGTNGKGSVCHMLAAVLARCGYRTGLYTSPHYLDFRERIRINGQKIGKDQVMQFVNRHKSLFDEVKPSFFEMTVAMAFDHFHQNEVEIAVIETGLGGRLDSTNVVTPLLSIITNVGLDHVDFLGDTPAKIAREKAGIIKNAVPAILGVADPGYADVFYSVAEERMSPLYLAEDQARVRISGSNPWSLRCQIETSDQWIDQMIELPVGGIYQADNLRTSLAAIAFLKDQLSRLEPQKVVQGLENFVALTGMIGRFQVVSDYPKIIVDGGHNADGIEGVLQSLASVTYKNLHIVLGFSKDKDLHDLIRLLPRSAHYYLCQANLPRAMPVNQVAEQMTVGLQVSTFSEVPKALEAARVAANEEDLILVSGSIFVVAEAIEHLGF